MTDLEGLRLGRLSLALRLAVTGLVLVLLAGYAASLVHVFRHHGGKDGRAGLSLADLEGAYHGLHSPSPLRAAVEGDHGREFLTDGSERRVLQEWLQGERISEGYDDLELGAAAPAEILDRRCLGCHARGATAEGAEDIGERVPLEYWDDVERVAFSRRLDPVPVDILVVSTHTHALTLPLVTALAALLLLATSFPRGLRHGLAATASLALLADVASWWLARLHPRFVPVLAASGALYGLALVAMLVLVLVEVWARRRS